jgi:uncharacterized membrane protein YoaK (UPF0700 family)
MSMKDAQKPAVVAIPLIFLLCAVAGSIDAVAYLLFGRVFVANMTGGTVLLAISLLQRNGGEAALRGGLITAFVAGVIVARLLARNADKPVAQTQRILVLGSEVLLLLLLGWKSTGANGHLLLLLLAGMLGSQNASFRYIGGFQLNTTFVTGDLEKLGEAVTDTRHSRKNTSALISAFSSSWIGYAGGAFLGALAARDIPQHAFLVPMVLTVASAAVLMLKPRRQ